MKLINLLKEAKNPKSLSSLGNKIDDQKLELIVGRLENMAGHYIIAELESLIYKGSKAKYPFLIDVLDKIESAYKKVDKDVAGMIKMAVNDGMVEVKNDKFEKLETIKKKASDIQDSLTLETKKRKKKKKK